MKLRHAILFTSRLSWRSASCGGSLLIVRTISETNALNVNAGAIDWKLVRPSAGQPLTEGLPKGEHPSTKEGDKTPIRLDPSH